MRWRVQLQPTITTGAAMTQESRYAKNVAQAVSGVALINVYRNSSGNALTFTLQTASQLGLASTFWTSVGSGGIAAGTIGIVKIAISDLGEWIRWDLT